MSGKDIADLKNIYDYLVAGQIYTKNQYTICLQTFVLWYIFIKINNKYKNP